MSQNQLVTLLGRLGADPELKYTQSQKAVCTFSIVEQMPDQGKSVWHKVVVWGKQGEDCKVHLAKGRSVFVQGRKSAKNYKNNEGEEKRFEELQVSVVGFINQ